MGRIYTLFFVTTVVVVIGEQPNKIHAELMVKSLARAREEKAVLKVIHSNRSNQICIAARLLTLSTRPRACFLPRPLFSSLPLLSLSLSTAVCVYVTICPVCHCSPKYLSETKGILRSSSLSRSSTTKRSNRSTSSIASGNFPSWPRCVLQTSTCV